MTIIESYLIGEKITTEFTFGKSKGCVIAGKNYSVHIWESANYSKAEINNILDEVPLITHGDFETLMF